MADTFITIGDLELVNILQDHYKLLIDDSTNGDTKAALVSVLRDYLAEHIKPSIDKTTYHWLIGDTDTGIVASGIELRYEHPMVQYCISGTDDWVDLFDITVLLPNVEIDNETLCWKINGVLTDKSAVNARINSMNGNVSIIGTDGIVIKNNEENNTITISRTDEYDNGIPPADVSNKKVIAGKGQVTIKWSDPLDLIDDEGIIYSIWDHTTLVRKIGSYPVDVNDGTVLVTNYTRDQYTENGYIDSGLTNGITYYYKLFIYAQDGSVNRNPQNNMIGLPIKDETYKIYGVRIDETNSNPETALEYTDDAIGMEAGSDDWDDTLIYTNIRPCLLKDGVVNYYLNKDDYNYKANGIDPADITSGNDGDVMVEIPKIAYMIYREGNYLYIKITDNPKAKMLDDRFCFYAHTREKEGDREKLYISAYGGSLIDGKLRSLSGKVQTSSQTIGTFRTQAQNNGNGYNILSFYPITLIQCLYLIKYKNLNSQSVIGNGASGNTGTLDTKGFTYGIPKTNGKIKLFGIEDLWGNIWCWVDGIVTNANWQVMTALNSFNDNGDNYTTYPNVLPSINGSFIKTVQGIRELGFLPNTKGGSTTTYYCDASYIMPSQLCAFGGYSGSGVVSAGGAFCWNLTYSASNSFSYLGARLMYL
mgnify:FL=1|jgi:hypothetical protein